MGMGQDLINDMMFQHHFDDMEMESLFDKKCWQTSDRRVLKIVDMGTGHLQNTINWLERNEHYPFADEFIECMKKELQKRVNHV